MILVVVFIGGMMTISSPCILPALPFVLSRADRSFVKGVLPMLAGMAITFAGVTTLAAIGGNWAVHANETGRYAAIALLTIFGVTMVSPRAASALNGPIVSLGNRLSSNGQDNTATGSLLAGVATGLLWTPCAGPILGLVLTGAIQDANAQATLLLLAYSTGAVGALAVALLTGGRLLATMKKSLRASGRIRQCLGAAVLAGVAAIAFGLDTSVLAQSSYASTSTAERALWQGFNTGRMSSAATGLGGRSITLAADDARANYRSNLPIEGSFPSLGGALGWLNSPPLSPEQLRGKVVLIDFWTYSCINCLRTIPYVRAWAKKYKDQGLVVIGVHTPEFAFERNIDNIKRAINRFQIDYSVAIDSNYRIWRDFHNTYWPAFYFIDANGQIRYHQFGEGNYDRSEKVIQALLAEAGNQVSEGSLVAPNARGAEVAPDLRDIHSGETYIGYREATNFASPEGLHKDTAQNYTVTEPGLNEWGLSGNWTVGPEEATLNQPGGGITYRFSARDLHLVLGPGADRKPVRFRVTIDGRPPGESHGADIDADGNGTITETRLYQLVRQTVAVKNRTFEIRFLDPGVEAFVFTFG